jgi:Holliday junction resolvase-like predicted endonuclease
MLTRRQQGDLGEISAMEWLVARGATVFVPVSHSRDVDLVAEWEDHLARVQVKTSRCRTPKGRWQVSLATRGGNQSWSGLVKHFDATRCDLLFVLAADGRRWLIPAGEVAGGSQIVLGGPKYSEFEVEAGRPFGDAPAGRATLRR